MNNGQDKILVISNSDPKFSNANSLQFLSTAFKEWQTSSQIKKQSAYLKLLISLSKLRNSAAIFIQKFYKAWIIRKDFSVFLHIDHKKLIRWVHEGTKVFIIANFTDPPWKELIPMKFSRSLQEFYSTIIIDKKLQRGNYCIKFLVDGKWMCDGNLAITQDQVGNYNNLISVSNQKNGISRSISVKSFQATGIDLACHIKSKNNVSPIIMVRSISGNLESPKGFGIIEEEHIKIPIKLVMNGHMIAKPLSKTSPLQEKGSQDAWFIDAEKQAFGVADGVSEWSTFGLDPSKFPNELINHCRNVLYEIDESDVEITDLLEHVVIEATQRNLSYGSSTLLLAVCRNSLLYTYCLGDSSFIVLRKREENYNLGTVYRSLEQQHSFNCPFQLSNLPKPNNFEELIQKGFNSLVNLLKRSNKSINDSPFDANLEMIPLKMGDIIIAGSDGLFDNLFDQEIIKNTESMWEKYKDLKTFTSNLAKFLAELAIEKGRDTNYKSPFARNAGKAGKKYIGGKLDDTTVIVAVAN